MVTQWGTFWVFAGRELWSDARHESVLWDHPGGSPAHRHTHKHTHNSFIDCSIEPGILLGGNGTLRAIAVPSAPRGKFDCFPGRRERPKQCRHTTISSSLSTYPTFLRSRRRTWLGSIAPSVPSLNLANRQSQAACPERPNHSTTFINLNIGLNLDPKNGRTEILMSNRPLESSVKTLLRKWNELHQN